VKDFKERMIAKIRRQQNIKVAEEQDFRQGELLGRYMAKLLYR